MDDIVCSTTKIEIFSFCIINNVSSTQGKRIKIDEQKKTHFLLTQITKQSHLLIYYIDNKVIIF